METAEKIITTDGSNNFANGAMMGASLNKNANDPALMAAMMNGGMNGQWNNPFVYLVWMMFANRWMGNYGNPTANTQRIIDTLNNHWSQNDQNRINSLESQLALSQQTQTILSQLNSASAASAKTTA